MGKLKLTVDSIEALSDAQKAVLVRTGIIRIEPTQAEEQLWQIALVMLDRSYIADLLGLQLSTFNTYISDGSSSLALSSHSVTSLLCITSTASLLSMLNKYTTTRLLVSFTRNKKDN